jgi:hypothetical protein
MNPKHVRKPYSADGPGKFKYGKQLCFRESHSRRHIRAYCDLSLALSIKRVVNDKFSLKNFVIAQLECAEAMCDPAKTLVGRMRIARMRVRCTHDLAEQKKRRIAQAILF